MGQISPDTSALSFSLFLFCAIALSSREIEGASNGEMTLTSAIVNVKVSLLCPHYVSGTVAWYFNNPLLTSPSAVAANGSVVAAYSKQFDLEPPGSDAHILVLQSPTFNDAGLYSCHPDKNVDQTQYVFLRVSKVVENRNETINGTDISPTTEPPYDWDKRAVAFYLVILIIIFAIFIGVMIVLCFRVQKSRFGLGKKTDKSTVDAEQQQLRTADTHQPGPSTKS